MKSIITVFFALAFNLCLAQENINIELVGQYETVSSANDIWGFVDKNGIEYAIVGTQDDTNVFSLEDPASPELLYTVSGTNTVWRDMKSYGDYVYSVTDNTSDGLTIIDMTDPKNGIEHSIYYPPMSVLIGADTIPTDTMIVNAHNLFVDENGILYMTGTNLLFGAPVFLDLNVDPLQPPVIGNLPVIGEIRTDYAHDIYVRGDSLYASEIYEGEMKIYDISDKSAPVELGGAATSFRFTHNAWLSDDGKTVFTTDERRNAYVDAYDISDAENVKKISRFRTRKNGDRVIPHNTHYHKGFLVTSWYGDGVIITDVNRPDNPVIVGRYDTNVDGVGGFVGCWGAYPFLPSGKILATDRQNGLFVLESPYNRAAYLEGCVTDAVTGETIMGAVLEITGTEINTGTNVFGNFKTGYASAGSYEIVISKNGYKRQVVTVDLSSGMTTELKIAMQPAELLAMNVKVVDSVTGNPVPAAKVEISSLDYDDFVIADGSGEIPLELYEEIYNFTIGAWGYYHKVESRALSATGDLILEVEPGYQDDFHFDFEWSVPDSVAWLRVDKDTDIVGDLGIQHYENWSPVSSSSFTSQVMDLSIYDEPRVSFYLKLFTADAFMVPTLIVNGEEVPIDSISHTNYDWEKLSYDLTEFTTAALENVYFKFDHKIFSGSTHRAEVDAFLVEEGRIPSSIAALEPQLFNVKPTLTTGKVEVSSIEGSIGEVSVFDLSGNLLLVQSKRRSDSITVDLGPFQSGIYLIKITDEKKSSQTIKVFKR